MLRLPPHEYHRPRSLDEAVELLHRFGDDAMVIAGGTDLIPNMKHRLFEPAHLVGLKGIGELRGIRREGGALAIGAAETLASVARHPEVRGRFAALAAAAGHVAGPQLRNAGTIGGNLCLDTRCTYYNQTEFWRRALGYCLKKDGTVCHVTKVGKKCVAAHSADTPPALIAFGARVEMRSPSGTRSVPVEDFFVPDGIRNNQRGPGETITRILIPLSFVSGADGAPGGADVDAAAGGDADGAVNRIRGSPNGDEELHLRSGYSKLRQRASIDFPLLTVAVAAWVDPGGRMQRLRGVVTALGARPRELTGWDEIAEGEALDDDVIDALAERARKQCRPLDNIIVDPEWRRAMVPVYVKRALIQLRDEPPS